MSQRPPELDVFETSSFSSLIQQEELGEILPLDLYTSSLIGDYDSVRGFIARKENLDKVNVGGWTALMYAAYVGRDNILNMLLEAGAKIDIPAKRNGLTALMLASYCASESIMYFLLQHGAAINARDHDGLTSLFHAVKQGHQSAVKLLASQGAELDLCHYQTGMTPLMEAAVAGYEGIFSVLMEHGADFMRSTKKGETVRNLAMRYGRTMIVNLIDKARIPMNSALREEPKLVNSGSAFGQDVNNSDIAKLNDGPNQVTNMFLEQRARLNNPQQARPIAALCPDFGNLMVQSNNSNTGSTDNNSLQMSGISHSTSGVYSSGDAGDINNISSQRKKTSRVASMPPVNVFASNTSQDFVALPSSFQEVLEEYKLDPYFPKFQAQGIDLSLFLELSEADLKEIGIDKLGPRKKIMIAIGKCKKRVKAQHSANHVDSTQTDQLQLQLHDLNFQLQQSFKYIQNLQTQLTNEQQYRSEVDSYLEAEQQRMRQIIFYTNDVGKSCKEALEQVRKIKTFNEKVHEFLQKIKSNPTLVSNELPIDPSIFDESTSIKCEAEMVSNRLDMTFKQAERTLMVAQLDMQQTAQNFNTS